MKLIVARHGESAWNHQGIIQGQLDSPLTALGLRQVTALGLALADTDIRHIYSSPAIRAMESAEQLAQQFQCQVTTDSRLHERHYGIFQGKSYQYLKEQYRELALPLLAGNPHATIPAGESVADVCDRLLSCIDELSSRYLQDTVMAVTHGDVLEILIWVLKGRQNNDDLRRYSHPNASFALLEIDVQKTTLVNWGMGTHLLKLI